jgi:uncharacterized surface protein with fasciclin (FAS1) repeats
LLAMRSFTTRRILVYLSFWHLHHAYSATLFDVIRTNTALSLLENEFSLHPELIERLKSTTQSLTLLAPNNDAFSTPDGALLQQQWSQRDAWQLHWNGVLTYLIWEEERTSRQIYQGLQQPTAWREETIDVQITRDGIFFQSPSSAPARLVRPDLTVENGQVQVVNGFPLPEFFSQSLWDVILQVSAEELAPFTRMRELIVMTELEGFLQNATAMTFLAAPDTAFMDPMFSNETLDLETASAILQNHMIPQVLPPALFVADSQVTTLFGQRLTITETEEGGIRIGSANVTQYSLWLGGNGIIHEVSTLLVPPNLNGTSLMDKLLEQAENNTSVDNFVRLLDTSWIEAYSNVQQNYTVFIAENSTLPNSTQIPSDWTRHIRRFVAHQTVPGMILAETQLRETLDAANVTGSFYEIDIPVDFDTALLQEITFRLDNQTEQVFIEQSLPQKVNVTTFDFISSAENGVAHFVSNPLVPPFWTTSLMDVVALYDDLSTLQALVVKFSLEDLISTYNRTLLAPTNAAFIRRGIDGLTPESIVDILSYHLLTNVFSSDQLPTNGSRRYMSVFGRTITVSRVSESSLQFNQQATTVITNVLHNQGIMHLIDTVLVPPLPNETDAPTTFPTTAPTRIETPTEVPLSTPTMEFSMGNGALSYEASFSFVLGLIISWAISY